jgi:hypothetical protein
MSGPLRHGGAGVGAAAPDDDELRVQDEIRIRRAFKHALKVGIRKRCKVFVHEALPFSQLSIFHNKTKVIARRVYIECSMRMLTMRHRSIEFLRADQGFFLSWGIASIRLAITTSRKWMFPAVASGCSNARPGAVSAAVEHYRSRFSQRLHPLRRMRQGLPDRPLDARRGRLSGSRFHRGGVHLLR